MEVYKISKKGETNMFESFNKDHKDITNFKIVNFRFFSFKSLFPEEDD